MLPLILRFWLIRRGKIIQLWCTMIVVYYVKTHVNLHFCSCQKPSSKSDKALVRTHGDPLYCLDRILTFIKRGWIHEIHIQPQIQAFRSVATSYWPVGGLRVLINVVYDYGFSWFRPSVSVLFHTSFNAATNRLMRHLKQHWCMIQLNHGNRAGSKLFL